MAHLTLEEACRLATQALRNAGAAEAMTLSLNTFDAKTLVTSNISLCPFFMTLHDLAAEYKVSAERIRQIEVAAMKKMKKALAAYA